MNSNKRKSGIELLKCIAIFMIMVNHVTQTMSEYVVGGGEGQPYLIDLTKASKNYNTIIYVLFRYFGAIGNDIFFVASSWFLCSKRERKTIRALEIIFDTDIISYVFLLIGFFLSWDMNLINILQSVIPFLTGAYWFVTCYVIVFLLSPYLNNILDKMSERHLKATSILLYILYFALSMVDGKLLYTSDLIVFVTMYIVIYYIKQTNKLNDNVKYSAFGFGGFFLILLLLIAGTNYAGLRVDFLNGKMLRWGRCSNPVIFGISLYMFNMFKSFKFENYFINYVSSLSLYIYLIHENMLVRQNIRPYIWNAIWNIDKGHRVIWIFVYSVCLFSASALLAYIYKIFVLKVGWKKIINKKLKRIVEIFDDYKY